MPSGLPNPESAGEIMLRVQSMVERHKLDSGIEHLLKTGVAPEDASSMLQDPSLKLDVARNPSSLLMNFAKPHARKAKADRSVGLVPMLRSIDRSCLSWAVDPEAEALLKFMVPCTKVLPWLEKLGNELPRSGSASSFVKTRVRRMLRELQDPHAEQRRAGTSPSRPQRDRSRSREHRDVRDSRDARDAGWHRRDADAPPSAGGGQWQASAGAGTPEVGGRGRFEGKGKGAGKFSTDPAALMAQIQRLQNELNQTKRSL